MNNPPNKKIIDFSNGIYHNSQPNENMMYFGNGLYDIIIWVVPKLIENIFKIILRIDQPDRYPIIYIIIVILVIVQIILFINTILYYTKYLHNDSNNDIVLFEKYPVFEYLKDENFMDIDAFFLKYDSPFPYIFIWYPFLIVIYLIYSNKYKIKYQHISFIFLIFLFIAYYFAFNFAMDIPTKNKIREFEEEYIRKHIINMRINTDIHYNVNNVNRQKILKILKYIIISDMEKNYKLNIDTIAKQIKDQFNDNDKTNIEYIKNALNADALNADTKDDNKITILELIYTYGNKGVIKEKDDISRIKYIKYIDKYFSLLINENIDATKINYSMYYILGLSSKDFVENKPTIFASDKTTVKFKNIILKLDELLDDTIYVNIKRYYIGMLIASVLIIIILIVSFWNEIRKAFSNFCRDFKLDRIKVAVIGIILVSFAIQSVVYIDIRNRANAEADDKEDQESAEAT
jgi:hypothetical protein